jgi:anti-anti-sigma regulatory factor
MPIKMRVVGVSQVPKMMSAKEGRMFLRELRNSINCDRPRLVLDCSKVQQIDKPLILLLLGCLEEVMKCNGDIKLADLPPDPEGMLRTTGVDRLFHTYQTTAEAVNSFHQCPAGMLSYLPEAMLSPQKSGIVA